MRINYTLKDGYINSYSIIPFDDKKPYIDITTEEEKLIITGKCKIVDNHIDSSEVAAKIEELEQRALKLKQISAIELWFADYDRQAIQYQRQTRLGIPTDINIHDLDVEAEQKAEELKLLKNQIAD